MLLKLKSNIEQLKMSSSEDCECEYISRITENMIKEKGYPLETHLVTTEDGYMNTAYRIPYSKENTPNENEFRTPVILAHGILCSSAVFVNNSRISYYLADQGYDVWLPNYRGTTFSRKHKTLDSVKDEEKFWDFSWHEIGIYDNSAFVDFILEKTGFKQLICIGHSQGTNTFNVLLSERPEYNKKISLCCHLGPTITFEHSRSLVMKFLCNGLIGSIEVLHKYLNFSFYQMPLTGRVRALVSHSKLNTLLYKISQFMLFLLAGHLDYEQTSWADLTQYCIASPNSCSVRQTYHFRQIVNNNRFAQYDHGPNKNLELYGSIKPPLYDLSKVTAPVAIFCGKNDLYSSPKDMAQLKKLMGNVVYIHIIDYELFNHVDFLLAKDSVELLYCHVTEIMKKYLPEKSK